LAAGRTYDLPVISLDVFPTALALAGAAMPRNHPPDGVNLLPFLAGTNTRRIRNFSGGWAGANKSPPAPT
jgi:arylsulfatase A-like enzyme